MERNMKSLLAKVAGRVQGVGFRDWTLRQAVALGLGGWVRNEADGTVSALLAGPPPAVEAMLERLGEGPSSAVVESVQIEDAGDEEAPSPFRIVG